jgi:hypothetical protein
MPLAGAGMACMGMLPLLAWIGSLVTLARRSHLATIVLALLAGALAAGWAIASELVLH